MKQLRNFTGRVWAAAICSLAAGLVVFWSSTVSGQTKPEWHFTVMASVGDSTVAHFGGLETVKQLIREQFDTVNSRFNKPGVFEGVFNFTVDSFHVFHDSPVDQVLQAHPDHDYQIVYDCFSSALGNWMWPPDNAVLLLIPLDSRDYDIFSNRAAKIITHELGHARGAVDTYGLMVSGDYNEVSHSWFYPVRSIMTFYTDSVWDLHSINVINRRGDRLLELGEFRLSSYFPSEMGIRLANVYGSSLPGSSVRVYAHVWYDLGLESAPIMTGQTDADGVFTFPDNPFNMPASEYPRENVWGVLNPTLLIQAEVYGSTRYFWLPFTTMQNRYFETGTEPYVHDFLVAPCSGDCDQTVDGYFVLYQNFPNPFNAGTEICVDLENESPLRVEIYNVAGQRQAMLCDEQRSEGRHYFSWEAGQSASGIYFCRVTVFGKSASRKMLLLK